MQISATLWLSRLLYFLVDWTELQNEEQYRQKLREQEMRENQPIVWDDEREREFRQKYINQRQVPGIFKSNSNLKQYQKHLLRMFRGKHFIISYQFTYDY